MATKFARTRCAGAVLCLILAYPRGTPPHKEQTYGDSFEVFRYGAAPHAREGRVGGVEDGRAQGRREEGREALLGAQVERRREALVGQALVGGRQQARVE